MQVIGFVLVVLGTLIFNEIIPISFSINTQQDLEMKKLGSSKVGSEREYMAFSKERGIESLILR